MDNRDFDALVAYIGELNQKLDWIIEALGRKQQSVLYICDNCGYTGEQQKVFDHCNTEHATEYTMRRFT